MKTLNELYTEVMDSEELKNEFLTLKSPEDIVAFAAKYGCTATLDEIKAFFEEKAQAAGELSEDELAQVAGGKGASVAEGIFSTISLGLGCGIYAIVSASLALKVCPDTVRFGTGIKGKHMICARLDENGNEIGMDDDFKEIGQNIKNTFSEIYREIYG